MKNFKLAMALLGCGLMLTGVNQAFAGGVGYIDYGRVQEGYPMAQQAIKDVDAKALELQQFMVDKEKQYKSLDTPLKKQNFEEATSRELDAKQDEYMRLRSQKEEAVYNNIQAAAKKVLVEQNLDVIIDYRVRFVGGVDVTDQVIQKLRSGI
ncbi:OmpH family outer membrane protein [bacterium]|nr:OmpH family outer membrane protein [bacterium]